MTREELAQEREAWKARVQARREAEAQHERRRYRIGAHNPNLRRGFERKLRDDEYLPARDAIETAISTRRG